MKDYIEHVSDEDNYADSPSRLHKRIQALEEMMVEIYTELRRLKTSQQFQYDKIVALADSVHTLEEKDSPVVDVKSLLSICDQGISDCDKTLGNLAKNRKEIE